MNETTLQFSLTCIAFVGQAIALVAAKNKQAVWRIGIYLGLIGSGLAAIGFSVPQLNLHPCTVMLTGVTIMLCCVAYDYMNSLRESLTRANLSPNDRLGLVEKKRQTALVMFIGIALSIVLSVIVGFTSVQQETTAVNEDLTTAFIQLSRRVDSLNGLILMKGAERDWRLEKLEHAERISAAERKIMLSNQDDIQRDLTDILTLLGKRSPPAKKRINPVVPVKPIEIRPWWKLGFSDSLPQSQYGYFNQ